MPQNEIEKIAAEAKFIIAGYYLYFTMACTIECMHVHASDTKLTESGSAKLFVKPDEDTIVMRQGTVSESDMNKIRKYIKLNYITMFEMWSKYSTHGYYGENK